MSNCPTTKENSKVVPLLIPVVLLAQVDQDVKKADTDRAKWVRQAIREKLQRKAS